MENASKALIMAAEVLLGIMLISIGVYLFNLFGSYSKQASDKITDVQIAEFNNQFLKYYGSTPNEDDPTKYEPIKCTIHDITSLANLAKKNNALYEVEQQNGYSENSYYVQIDVKNRKNIEKYTGNQLVDLIKQNDLLTTVNENGKEEKETKYYKCSQYHISESTRRVNYIQFVEI